MRYTDEERQAALDCLAANDGDFRQTSKRTGISVRTLKRWARQESASGNELRQLRDQLAAFRSQQRTAPHGDMRQQFVEDVLAIMMDDAIRLADAIDKAIDDAPLNQLSSALNQSLDKILKLLEILPKHGEQVLRVEYVYPDGTIHGAAYGTDEDSGE